MNQTAQPHASGVSSHQSRQRACALCSRAKVKCVWSNDAVNCQRCSRLNKTCLALPARARKPRESSQANRVSKTNVAALEEKLDDLVNLLKNKQDSGEPVIAPAPQLGHAEAITTPSQTIQDDNTEIDAAIWDDRLHRGGTLQHRFGLPREEMLQLQKPFLLNSKEPTPHISAHIDLGPEDPDTLLNLFRNEMKGPFPFISIPDHVNAEELRRTRPALFISIMVVTTRITAQQKSISTLQMKILSERVMVGGERNLDLLLATLTYAGWCYYHFFNNIQFTALLSLASILIADLRFNRPNPPTEGPLMTALRASRGLDSAEGIKTLEDHRALLCYWYLTSIISTFFHKLKPITWTSHLETSYNILASSLDRNDRWVAHLTKVQLVTERITQSPWHDRLASKSTAPPALYMHSLRQQLLDLKKTTSPEFEANPTLHLAYLHAEITLYKIGLSKSIALSNFLSHDFDRVEYLHSCLQAVKSFFDLYFNLPMSTPHSFNVATGTYFTWSLGVLQLLTTFEHPDWNLAWVRATISFTDTLGKLADKYGQAKEVLGLDPHTSAAVDLFSHSAQRFSWIKSFFEFREANAQSQPMSQGFESGSIPNFPLGNDIDFMDDEWMHDLLELW